MLTLIRLDTYVQGVISMPIYATGATGATNNLSTRRKQRMFQIFIKFVIIQLITYVFDMLGMFC